MSNEDFRNEQGGTSFEGDPFGESREQRAEDISGVVENLSKPRSMIYSVVSLVLGIISVLICCCGGWFGLGIGVLAIVFSVISRRHLGYFDGMAIAGLVLGICGAVFGAATVVLGIMIESGALEAFFEGLLEGLEDGASALPENAF